MCATSQRAHRLRQKKIKSSGWKRTRHVHAPPGSRTHAGFPIRSAHLNEFRPCANTNTHDERRFILSSPPSLSAQSPKTNTRPISRDWTSSSWKTFHVDVQVLNGSVTTSQTVYRINTSYCESRGALYCVSVCVFRVQRLVIGPH